MGGEQKLKENDEIIEQIEATNNTELLFFSDKFKVYKTKASEFADTKASVLGDYVPAKVQMDDGESAIYMAATSDYSGFMLFVFENGKMAKIDMSSYITKTNRKKLINAYSDKSPLVTMFCMQEDKDILMTSSNAKSLIINTAMLETKTTKNSQGVQAQSLKAGARIIDAHFYQEGELSDPSKYRRKLGAFGIEIKEPEEQLTLE